MTERDYNGMRGGTPICVGGRLHDLPTIRVLREAVEYLLAQKWWRR